MIQADLLEYQFGECEAFRKEHEVQVAKFKRNVVFCGSLIVVGALLMVSRRLPSGQAEPASRSAPSAVGERSSSPIDGARCYGYLKQICELGARPSGSAAMTAQQALLAKHFRRLGGRVGYQRFRVRHPLDGSLVSMANLVVQWHPEAKQRVLLCAHYDTRPLPDRDPNAWQRRHGTFIGANDGASGVAVLMELAHLMQTQPGRYGVDFCLFDGEEFVYDDQRDHYFLGSEWFARKYIATPPPFAYRWGVLLDMVGDARLGIYQEVYSMSWPDTRPLVKQIWQTADRLGVKEFIARPKHKIRDDHLKLRGVAKIPTCNIIDFEYPDEQNRYWHTTSDTPEHCSPSSLAKVAWVVYEWLKTAE